MIIALSGPMGSGKSTVIDMLKTMGYFKLIKFAGPLYEMQTEIYRIAGLPMPEPKDRKLLQWLGTDWGRSISATLWVDIWSKAALRANSYGVNVVSDDCRFDNEAETVKAMSGKVVRILAEPSVRADRIKLEGLNHVSEAGIADKYVDYTLNNNGDINFLRAQVEEMFTLFDKTNSEFGRPEGQHG